MTHSLCLQSSAISRWLFAGTKRTSHCENSRRFCAVPENHEYDSSSWRSMEGLFRCPANHVPLTPISFLERAGRVYGDHTSVVYGSLKFTWEQTLQRCLSLASALEQLGISTGDVVAALAPNVPAMQELHFAVPMAGAAICPLNTRHDSAMISILLQHSEAKIIFVDYQLLHIARGALDLLAANNVKRPILVIIPELNPSSPSTTTASDGAYEYESLLSGGDGKFLIKRPTTEWDPISINYTSGTTSRPKGVVFNHRGAYLNAIATTNIHGMSLMPNYLWTVPMFHCNGWCLIWGLAALGGTNICLRHVSVQEIFKNILLNNVTHMSGAPTVLNMIINSKPAQKPLINKIDIMTAGSPPPQPVISKMEELGFSVRHMYGLTELHGPGTLCVLKPEWDSLTHKEQIKLKARQGFEHYAVEELDVKDPVTMVSVPRDGVTAGEIMFRGNTVMSGYLKDVKATEEAFAGGWFRSGDLGVKHKDGYIEVKDRLKDIVIIGGENVSTIEVETVLYEHPAVFEAAVVARPDNHWGQTPCAFVKLKEGHEIDSKELIRFCRDRLPRYMTPRTVVFQDLPKTSTGKIQKFILREKAKAMGSLYERQFRKTRLEVAAATSSSNSEDDEEHA